MNVWNVYLQGSECICIKGVGRTSWSTSADPSNCNFQCQNTSNIYKNECGGNSSYNVFEFISGISTQIIYFLFDMHFFQWISKISYEATVGATLITLIILFIICLFISLVFFTNLLFIQRNYYPFFIRSPESLRWRIGMGWGPSSVVR